MKNFFFICTVIHIQWILVLSHSHITLFTFFGLKVNEEQIACCCIVNDILKNTVEEIRNVYKIVIRNLTGRNSFGDEV
jgi:hypothetical protein